MRRTPDDIQNELLVIRARGGDAAAFRDLARRLSPALLAHARRLTGSHEEAEDALQEAWVSIVKGLRRVEDPGAFRSWAYRVVTRRCADLARGAQRRRRTDRAAIRPTATDAGEPADDEASRLRRAIDDLEPDLAIAVRLHYADGFTVREIARIVATNPNTVKSRLARARRRLADALGEPAERTER